MIDNSISLFSYQLTLAAKPSFSAFMCLMFDHLLCPAHLICVASTRGGVARARVTPRHVLTTGHTVIPCTEAALQVVTSRLISCFHVKD